MLKVSKAELARRLEQKKECANGGEVGLNILIYGWLKFRKYGRKYRNKLYNRDWLYIVEVHDLSDYAQVDLTH